MRLFRKAEKEKPVINPASADKDIKNITPESETVQTAAPEEKDMKENPEASEKAPEEKTASEETKESRENPEETSRESEENSKESEENPEETEENSEESEEKTEETEENSEATEENSKESEENSKETEAEANANAEASEKTISNAEATGVNSEATEEIGVNSEATEETSVNAEAAEETAANAEETAANTEATDANASEPAESEEQTNSEEALLEAIVSAQSQSQQVDLEEDDGDVQVPKGHPVLISCVLVSALVAGLAAGYIAKAYTYKERFIGGTTINGVDVSEMTIAEVEEAIKANVEDYELELTFPDGSKETLSVEEMGLTYVSDGGVEKLAHEVQNPYLWAGAYLGKTQEYQVAENYTYDEETLKASLDQMAPFQEKNITDAKDAHLAVNEENQFEIIPEEKGNRLDQDQMMKDIGVAIDAKTEGVTFDENMYLQPQILADDKDLIAQEEKLNAFLDTKITLQLHDGSEYVVDKEILKDWIVADTENPYNYILEDEQIHEKCLALAADIASVDDFSTSTYPFKSTLSGTITLNSWTYGCSIDQAVEGEQLYQDILAGGETTRKPNYVDSIHYPVNKNYAEVDIRNQRVFMYKDGKLIVDTPCVTGTDTDPERRSDRGLFYVTWRVKDHTMYGERDASGNPSYASFVNFAVYYNGGEALHDASWRSSFGGSTYMYSGSHGCINLPYNAAKTIYENSYEGMPVIVFD